MDVRLEVVHEKSKVREIVLRRDTLIGRGKDCNLRVSVEEVSRRHCQITLEDGRVLLRDLGSSNGTRLEGKTIPAGRDVFVAPGESIRVGPVEFIVHYEPAATGEFPPLADTAEFRVTDGLIAGASSAHVTDDSDEVDGSEPRTGDTDLLPGLSPDTLRTAEAPDELTTETAPATDESAVELPLAADESEPVTEDKPVKSRSLFSLFRRRRRPADEGEDSDEDGLVEEPIEELGDDRLESDVEDPVEELATEAEPAEEEVDDTVAVISNESDSIVVDFLPADDQRIEDEDPPSDDDLAGFLGQFGGE